MTTLCTRKAERTASRARINGASGTNAGWFLRRSTTSATEPADATSRLRGQEALSHRWPSGSRCRTYTATGYGILASMYCLVALGRATVTKEGRSYVYSIKG